MNIRTCFAAVATLAALPAIAQMPIAGSGNAAPAGIDEVVGRTGEDGARPCRPARPDAAPWPTMVA